jgi:hypothetical protein
MMRKCSILLIDEISMLRCEVLDIVDCKLKAVRENNLPFGGMKLLFFGDFCQMEPVVQWFERPILENLYPNCSGDFNFYNSKAMSENQFFERVFDIFQIDEDYRHKDDVLFRDILSEIRLGKITEKANNIINSRYRNDGFINESFQYLTVTKAMAQKYNSIFISMLKGKLHTSKARIEKKYPLDDRIIENIKHPFYNELPIKENMKIMFVQNDRFNNGQRWVNGTIGVIKKIIFNNIINEITSITIIINGKDEVDVKREKIQLHCCFNNTIIEAATIEQFPIVPAWAITIDKSQGLTLDKIAIVLEKKNRDNQVYVALSRARKLSDIVILGHKLRQCDVRLSDTIKIFLDKINPKIMHVKNDGNYHNSNQTNINVINSQTVSITINGNIPNRHIIIKKTKCQSA